MTKLDDNLARIYDILVGWLDDDEQPQDESIDKETDLPEDEIKEG